MGDQRRRLSSAEPAGRWTGLAGQARDRRQQGSAVPAHQAADPLRQPPPLSSEPSAHARRTGDDQAVGRASEAPGATRPQAPRPDPAWGIPGQAATATPPPATRQPRRPEHAAKGRTPSGLARAPGRTSVAARPSSPPWSSAWRPGTAPTSMPDRLNSGRHSEHDKQTAVMRQAITYTLAEPDEELTSNWPQAPRQAMTTTHPQHPELPALLRVEQACRLLGISRSAGYRAATAGDLPILRLGRRIYVPTGRLLAMLGLLAEDSR